MYQCESCNKRFDKLEYNYSTDEGNNVTRIHQDSDSDFSVMEYVNSGTSWISCPECGSDMIIDLEELIQGDTI